MSRTKHNPVPQTAYQAAAVIKRRQKQLGTLFEDITKLERKLAFLTWRAVESCQPRGTGSIVGSVIQVPKRDPAHERYFEWLDAVRDGLEQLVASAGDL